MKDYKEESKRIKSELKQINERSNQICRILDKDDIDIDFINKIGQKRYIKTPNKNQNILYSYLYQFSLIQFNKHSNNFEIF